MIFRVYGLEANSYVDGPGVRLAIFFRGVCTTARAVRIQAPGQCMAVRKWIRNSLKN